MSILLPCQPCIVLTLYLPTTGRPQLVNEPHSKAYHGSSLPTNPDYCLLKVGTCGELRCALISTLIRALIDTPFADSAETALVGRQLPTSLNSMQYNTPTESVN